jgi:cell division protein DivIC
VNSRRLLVTLYALLFVGLGVGAGALFIDARAEYNQLKQAEAARKQQLAEAQTRLAEQEKILERLRTDPKFVEDTIRRRLGYAKPGESILRFEK